MLSQLLNLEKYTPFEFVLFAGGCYLWVVAYFVLIWRIRKFKFVEMPVFAACGNIGWEFVWAWLHRTDMGPGLVWCYRAWFLIDVYIFWCVFQYGGKQIVTDALRKHFKPICAGLAVLWAIFVHTMILQGLDTPIGANSAYIAQLGISSIYLILLAQGRNLQYFSWTIAWMRTVGTGTNTVFMCIHPEYDGFWMLRFCAVLSTVLDIAYCPPADGSGAGPRAGDGLRGRSRRGCPSAPRGTVSWSRRREPRPCPTRGGFHVSPRDQPHEVV